MTRYFAIAVLAGFLAASPVRADVPFGPSFGEPGTTYGMASEFNQLLALLGDEALRDIMCRLSSARFTPGRLSAALGLPEGQVLRRINTLRRWGLVRMVRRDSVTTIVEPIPGDGAQTMRRWASRYCSEGDSCGRPVANADGHRSEGQRGEEKNVAGGGMVPLGGGEAALGEGERKAVRGSVIWFSTIKGFGFIKPDDGSQDVFVHRDAVQRSGLADLRPGQKVTFDLVQGRSEKLAAENLDIVGSPRSDGQTGKREESAKRGGWDTKGFGGKSALKGDGKPAGGTADHTYVTDNEFSELGLAVPLQRALNSRKHIHPTPIQAKAIPKLLAGDDVLGIAQTGTGKTAAFALPILHKLLQKGVSNLPHRPRALILAPTRELAIQIGEEFRAYARYMPTRHVVIYGGVGQKPQVDALTRGVDVAIATPGRLLDLMDQGHIKLRAIEFFVLDEADRMLDMGFVPDIREIESALPRIHQSLMFSATMPSEIARLSGDILVDPIRVEVAPQATPVERIEQSVYHVSTPRKGALLANILEDPNLSRVLVFARTKYRVDRVTDRLKRCGIRTAAIHSDKSQNARQRALQRFRDGDVRVLVATDIAARGIDVDGITHVINYELPNEPEGYVHRIGRTARAGADGQAVSFCDTHEIGYLRDIERLLGYEVNVIGEKPVAASYDVRRKSRTPYGGYRNKRRWHRRRRNIKRPVHRGGRPRAGLAARNVRQSSFAGAR